MVKMGFSKPNRHDKENLGNYLDNYTRKTNPHYDSEFRERLKEIRPDWFLTPQEKMNERKKLYLLMAEGGAKRPGSKDTVWNYTTENQTYFDPIFTEKLKKLRPDWFEPRISEKRIRHQKKFKKRMQDKSFVARSRLIAYAKKNKKMPEPNTKDYNLLRSLTYKGSPRYNKEFDLKIKKLRPDWNFKSRSKKTLDCIKNNKLINLLKNSEPIIENKKIR